MSEDQDMTNTENNINETDFEKLSLETLSINSSSIIQNLPVDENDERKKLYENHQLAKTLLTSTDEDLKIFFIHKMKDIFSYYLREMIFDNDNGHYTDILQGMTTQGQVTFLTNMKNIKDLMIDYVNNYVLYTIEFALNKVIEITRYFIEFINPFYTVELDLSILQL